jgi:hypothetical protein
MYVNLQTILPSKFSRVVTLVLYIGEVLISKLGHDIDCLEILPAFPYSLQANSRMAGLPLFKL